MSYEIYPLYCGESEMPKSKVFYQGAPPEEMVRFAYGCFLLKNEDGEYWLIDTGYPMPDITEAGGYDDFFVTPRNMVRSMDDLLAPMGITPAQISKVIFTHLHFDHAWNLQCFPNAVFYAQIEEMKCAVDPLPTYNERDRAYALSERVFKDSWIRFLPRFVPIRGDVRDFLPGISTMVVGSHSVGSQIILIEGRAHTYAVVGDYAINLDSIYHRIPVGCIINMQQWFDVYPRVKKLMDDGVVFLANHDLRTYEQKCYL